MNNYCYNCGKPLQPNAITCPECGVHLHNSHERRLLVWNKTQRMNFLLGLLIIFTYTMLLSSHSALADTAWFQDYFSFAFGFFMTFLTIIYALVVFSISGAAFKNYEIDDKTRLTSIFLLIVSLFPIYILIEAFVWY